MSLDFDHGIDNESRSAMAALAGDPAELMSDFGSHLERIALPLDVRPDDHVAAEALNDASPVVREQSLFEYARRNRADAIDLLAEAVTSDPHREVRWNSLWALQKIGGPRALEVIRKGLKDDDEDVAEWAMIFAAELETNRAAFDGRSAKYYEGKTFDEVLYLNISVNCYVKLDPAGRHWGMLTLSPQGLARSYGQAHACPNIETRDHTLIISKVNSLLHEDGTPHVENFPFHGMTSRADDGVGSFRFEANVTRPVFLSGKADDDSRGVVPAMITVPRFGQWTLDSRIQLKGESAIRYVRGRVNTWAYVDIDRMQVSAMEEILFPGNSILGTPQGTPETPLANAYVSGTFKGKLVDWDGDGRVDLNSIDIYATREGAIDSNLDGIADEPATHYCMRTNWLG